MPAFFWYVARNIPDAAAFRLTIEEAGIARATLPGGNGNTSSGIFGDSLEAGFGYIMPLKRNTKEAGLAGIEFEDMFLYNGRRFVPIKSRGSVIALLSTGMRGCAVKSSQAIWNGRRYPTLKWKKEEIRRRKDLRHIPAEAKEPVAKFGIIVLGTSLMGVSSRYGTYKIRREIEQLFKLLRGAFCQDASYIGDDAGIEAWSSLPNPLNHTFERAIEV
ncbi:MAG: hypothetical protein FWG10_04460 [Eubacteriaceae bacterium]|nr:hypothetical protein [Eubacteriaceae bacterium]